MLKYLSMARMVKLEAKYIQSKRENAPIALILHPHPEYGGTMNNRVVYNAYHTFLKNGFSVCRFNFRGVGKSEGKFEKRTWRVSRCSGCFRLCTKR